MRHWHTAIVVALGWLLTGTLSAGEYNEVLNIGDAAPAWSSLDGIDGKKHALAHQFLLADDTFVAPGIETRDYGRALTQ